MNKNLFLILLILPLFAGCVGPTGKEIGQAVIAISPMIFIVSIVVQLIIFNVWRIKMKDIVINSRPNIIFFAILILLSLFFGNSKEAGAVSCSFVFIYIITLFIVTHIGLLFSRDIFTWSSVLTMTIFIVLSFMMISSPPPSYPPIKKGEILSRPHVNLKLTETDNNK